MISKKAADFSDEITCRIRWKRALLSERPTVLEKGALSEVDVLI
jgi:hypothetical protein